MIDSRTVIISGLEARKTTQMSIAEKMGMSPQGLGQKLGRRSVRADEYLKILDLLDIDVKYIDRQTGQELRIVDNGVGRRVKGRSKGILFDSAECTALGNTFLPNGLFPDNKEAQELYVDSEGRYFIVDYFAIRGKKDKARLVAKDQAAEFLVHVREWQELHSSDNLPENNSDPEE